MSSGFVPYQIDFSAIAAGKRVSSTKRKVRWRFGYCSQQALADGRTGTDCRGEEHDVTIVWSITSGKRQISMDGKEIHYSTNRAGLLEFNWQTKGNHVVKVTCHAAPPMTAQPEFRQYDLSIDGQSFFTMPKVFQLGIKGAVPNSMSGAYRSNYSSPGAMRSQNLKGDAPFTREQEEADLRRAIEASVNESRQHLGETPNGTQKSYTNPPPGAPGAYANSNKQVDLLGFADPPPHPAAPFRPPSDSRSVASYYSAPTTYGQGFQSPPPPTYSTPAPPSSASGAIVPAVAPPGYYQAPPAAAPVPPPYASPAPPSYASPAPPSYPSPAPPPYASPVPPTYANPVPIQPAYASPPPPQQAFGSPPPVPPAPASTPAVGVFGLHSTRVEDPFAPKLPPPVTHQDLTNAILASYQFPTPGTAEPQTLMADAGAPPTTPGTPHTPGTNGGVTLSMNQLTLTALEEKPKSDFEKALSNLVNVDHIDEPAEGEFKLTMMRTENARNVVNGKSVPKPPVGAGMISSNAPLSQIKKDFKSPGNISSEGVMNAPPQGVFHPNAAHAGALVVHGQGAPPLQQAQGFGVGQMLPNGGFQKQQNLAPGQYMQQQQLY